MRRVVWVLAAALLVAGCGGSDEQPSDSPSPSPTEVASSPTTPGPATPSPTTPGPATPSPTTPGPIGPTPSGSATPTSAACEPFGSTADQSSPDPLLMSSLFGEEIRLGRHDCYDRFVLQLQGSGDMPGWTVGYRDPLIGDPSGEVIELRGGASLDVVVRAWTVVPYQGMPADWLPFDGPTQVLPEGFTAIQEVRYLSAFEGSTQFGIGVDRQRPFRAFSLEGPPRLVIDIAHQ